jgi:predicted metalloendopeptidase
MKKLLFLFLIPLSLSATAQKPKEDFKGKLLYYLDKLNANGKVDSANCFAVQIKINNVGLIEKTTIFYEDSTSLRSISEEQFSNLYSRTDLLKDEKNKLITLSANTYVLPFVIVYQGNYSKIETLRILTYQGIEQLVRLLNAAKTSKSELLTPAVVFTGEPLY